MQDWIYCSSYLRALEKYLLDYNTLIKWSEAQNTEVLLKYIKDSVYSNYFENVGIEKYEDIFEKNVIELYREIETLIPDRSIISVYRSQYDLNNIKIVLKNSLLGKTIEWQNLSENGNIPPEEIYSLIEEKLYGKLHPILAKALMLAEEEYQKRNNPQIIDFILDSAYWDYKYNVLNCYEGYCNVQKHYRFIIDMENIKNIIRAKTINMEQQSLSFILLENGYISRHLFNEIYQKSLADILEEILRTSYGNNLEKGIHALLNGEGYSLLEKQMDELIMDKLYGFKGTMSGPEVIEEYLSYKKMEVKNLKIIFIGIQNDIPPENIKSRLREVIH